MLNSRLFLLLITLVVTTLGLQDVKGQLVVNANNNAQQLVQTLMGSGITVSNVVMNCPQGAAGTFNGTATNIGINNGVMLTTGSVAIAAQPNLGGGSGQDNFAPGDVDLTAAGGFNTFDACALEFDFVALCDTISIAYVFASDEYDEYVCGIVNDVFGFFLTGPGYANTNIAVVPNTSTPVSINTVNIGVQGAFGGGGTNCVYTNTAYYQQNLGTTHEYDGQTVKMLAMAPVTPCATYHVKLVIADGGDGVFDSGVFLESNGFQCTDQIITLETSITTPGLASAIEGCVDGLLTIERGGDTTLPYTINYTLGGSAIPGVDYNALPSTITFAAFQTSLSFPIIANVDNIVEGQEDIYIIVTDTFCGFPTSDTAFLYINDVPTISAGPDQSFCEDDTIQIGAPLVVPFSYQWVPATGLNNSTLPDPLLTLTSPGVYDYEVIGTDTNGCVDRDTVTLTVRDAPESPFSAASNVCVNQPLTVTYTGGAGPTAAFNWNFGGGTVISGTGAGPYVLVYNTPGQVDITLVVTENNCPSPLTILSVTVQPTPTLAPTVTNVSCFGFSDGQVLSNASGGTPTYQYLWSTGATSTNLNNMIPGTYTVTLTDNFGCRDTATAVVTQPSQLQNTFTHSPILCFGGTGSITANTIGGNGQYSYVWSNGATSQTAAGLVAGTYTVTVTDATQGLTPCQIIGSFTLTQPSQVQINVSSTPSSCNVNNGTAAVPATGGTAPFQYLWSNGATGSYITGLAPGTYSVTVTDANGCQANGSTTVGLVPSPTVTAGLDASFCEGEGGVEISAVGSGGTPSYFYTWWCATPPCALDSAFDNDPMVNPPSSQWYYVQVTDINGCTSNVDSLYVTILPKPIVDAGPDLYLCGDSAPCQVLTPTISAAPGPYVFSWLYSAGLNDSTIMNPCARPDTTTTYALVVTAGNGCTSDYTTTDTLSTVVVHVNPIPVGEAGPDLHICFGDSAMLQAYATSAGPIYDFQWSPTTGLSNSNIPNPYAGPSATTEYILTVWSNGCPSYGDPVTVNVHTQPTVDAGPVREICLGDSILLDAQASGDSTATYTYLWSPAASLNDPTLEDPTASPDSTTWYHVIATSSYGCGNSHDSVLVRLIPSPLAEAGPNVTLCEGLELVLQGSYSYSSTDPAPPSEVYFSWTPSSTLSDSTILQPVAQPLVSTVYYLTVRHQFCTSTDSVIVSVVPDLALTVSADTNITCEGDSVLLTAVAGNGGASFVWSPSTGLANPTSSMTMAAPSQTTTYIITASQGGCVGVDSLTIEVLPIPEANYLSSTPNGCAPLEVSFTETSRGGVFHVWDFGDGSPVDNTPAPMHTYTEPGTYIVSLMIVNPGGCADSVSNLLIQVAEPPVAAFVSDPDYPSTLTLGNSSVQFVNTSTSITSAQWNFGDGQNASEMSPSHTYQAEGTYYVTLQVSNAEGCVDAVTHGPYVIVAPDLFIPNVFSPNGDGLNDVFRVDYGGQQPFYLRVVDRWGVILAESRDKMEGWDGLDQKGSAVPEGVYFYVLRVGDRDFTGEVTLIR